MLQGEQKCLISIFGTLTLFPEFISSLIALHQNNATPAVIIIKTKLYQNDAAPALGSTVKYCAASAFALTLYVGFVEQSSLNCYKYITVQSFQCSSFFVL
jgi:hypothetical protein